MVSSMRACLVMVVSVRTSLTDKFECAVKYARGLYIATWSAGKAAVWHQLSETDTAAVERPLTKGFKVFVLRTFGYDRVQFILLAVSAVSWNSLWCLTGNCARGNVCTSEWICKTSTRTELSTGSLFQCNYKTSTRFTSIHNVYSLNGMELVTL